MQKLIDANEVLNAIIKELKFYQMLDSDDHAMDVGIGLAKAIQIVVQEKPVHPIRYGHWIKHKKEIPGGAITYFECSECHEQVFNNTNYCPDCGAENERVVVDDV